MSARRGVKGASVAIAIVAAAALAGACGGGEGAGSGDEASTGSGCFLAFTPQLAGFRGWTSYHYDAPASVGGSVHVAGPRTEYLSAPPPHGSAAFPVGTIIVKEVGTDAASHHLFAMVKRGCGFNASGARDWEWMEIAEGQGGPTILWRGVGPPAGEQYGGDANAGCNSCHVGCASNDDVCSPSIKLSAF